MHLASVVGGLFETDCNAINDADASLASIDNLTKVTKPLARLHLNLEFQDTTQELSKYSNSVVFVAVKTTTTEKRSNQKT